HVDDDVGPHIPKHVPVLGQLLAIPDDIRDPGGYGTLAAMEHGPAVAAANQAGNDMPPNESCPADHENAHPTALARYFAKHNAQPAGRVLPLEHDIWFDVRGPARRYVTGDEGNETEHHANHPKSQWIGWAHFIQEVCE